MIRSKSAGGVILNKDGKVLVVSQHSTSWSLPKGKLEEGENLREAAAREIREETGITKLKFIKKLGTYQRYKIARDGGEDTSEFKTITMFLYTTPEENPKPEDPDNPEAKWLEPDEISRLLTHPKDKSFYDRIRPDLTG